MSTAETITPEMSGRSLVIVTPALADANNGNWQTASRWQRMLSPHYRARIVRAWPDDQGAKEDVAMVALHARRSADSISAWSQANPGRGLAVVLTGTDLYQDIQHDPSAQRALEIAQQLVVLQECGAEALAARLRPKVRTIFQSTTGRVEIAKTDAHLRAIMVGHLRSVKSPETLFEAARLLMGERNILIDHVGDALDADLGVTAQATASACPNYRWLGGQPHETVRRRIQRAHVLVHASRMEGGAHVIMEAIACGTPVLASRVPGNVGMLGRDYAGYFEHGDAVELARLLMRCRNDLSERPTQATLLRRLQTQCAQRLPLFAPSTEQAAVRALAHELLRT